MRLHPRRRRDRGALMGIVLVLLVIIAAAGAFTAWTVTNNTSGARNDRLQRQLLDCAEQGLAYGKQWFGITQRSYWDNFLNTNVCTATGSMLPCGPFPTGATNTNVPAGYPASTPYTQDVIVGNGLTLTWHIGIYNPPENTTSCATTTDPLCQYHDGDNTVVLYSRCIAPTGEERTTQVMLYVPLAQNPCAYKGQQGFGCNNGSNMN
jgi:Tfp pilus assembly protein PilX